MATAPQRQYPATIERNGKVYAFSSSMRNMAKEQLVWFACVTDPSCKYVLVDVGDELVEFDFARRLNEQWNDPAQFAKGK